MSLAAGERKKEMVQIECRWVEWTKLYFFSVAYIMLAVIHATATTIW